MYRNVLLLQIFLLLMSFSYIGYASDVSIKLLPNDNASVIDAPLEIVQMSGTLKTMIDDLGPAAFEKNVPVDIRTSTLIILINVLKLTKTVLAKKENFPNRIEIIKQAFSGDINEKNTYEFLCAVNYLGIKELLPPAMSLWFESTVKRLPSDLKSLLRQSLPYSSLYPKNSRFQAVEGFPSGLLIKKFLAVLGKLYVVTDITYKGIYVINTENNQLEHIINIEEPEDLAQENGEIYCAHSSRSAPKISVINTKNNQIVSSSFFSDVKTYAVAAHKNKLYLLDIRNEKNCVTVVDIGSQKVVGQPIAITNYPKKLIALNEKIYVFTQNGISIIDADNDRLKNFHIPLEFTPKRFTIVDGKIYVIGFPAKKISVIDIANDQLLNDQTIALTESPRAIASFEDNLLVLTVEEDIYTLLFFDTKDHRLLGSKLLNFTQFNDMIVADNKLYLARGGPHTLISLDLNYLHWFGWEVKKE